MFKEQQCAGWDALSLLDSRGQSGSQVLRRRHNASGHMEYWVEPVGMAFEQHLSQGPGAWGSAWLGAAALDASQAADRLIMFHQARASSRRRKCRDSCLCARSTAEFVAEVVNTGIEVQKGDTFASVGE